MPEISVQDRSGQWGKQSRAVKGGMGVRPCPDAGWERGLGLSVEGGNSNWMCLFRKYDRGGFGGAKAMGTVRNSANESSLPIHYFYTNIGSSCPHDDPFCVRSGGISSPASGSRPLTGIWPLCNQVASAVRKFNSNTSLTSPREC